MHVQLTKRQRKRVTYGLLAGFGKEQSEEWARYDPDFAMD